MREITNDTEPTGGDDFREQVIDEGLDEFAVAADRRRTEDFVQQTPDACVVGRIDIDEPVRIVIDQRFELRELSRIEIALKQAGDPADIREAFGILEAGAHIVVTGDDPAIPDIRPLHRIGFAKLLVNRIRIGGELGSVNDVVEFHGMGLGLKWCVNHETHELHERRHVTRNRF